MFNLLKSDLYKLAHQVYFWAFALICVVCLVLVAGMMAYVASPEFTMMVNQNMLDNGTLSPEEVAEVQEDIVEAQALNSKELDSLTITWANTFLNGGFLGIFASCCIALFLVRDFKSGFIKNLNMSKRGRLVYFSEKLVLTALVSAFFLALCIGSCTLAFQAFGFTYLEVESAGSVVLWVLLAWLMTFAYSCWAACVACLLRSEGVVAAFGVLVCSGVAGAFLIQLALLLGKALPVLNALPYWTLAGSNSTLAAGAGSLLTYNASFPIPALYPWGQVLLCEALFLAAAFVLTYAVCRKRNVA